MTIDSNEAREEPVVEGPCRISVAMLSVSDKSGLVPLAEALAKHNIEMVSTGGTRKVLVEAGLKVDDVADFTGFPEMMDGRVKALHPKVHGGLMGKRADRGHRADMERHGIRAIDLLIVNLYPFEAVFQTGAATDSECIDSIDIGGQAMIRAAAKNYEDVTVIVDPSDYEILLDELSEHAGTTTLALRRRLAAKAFARTAAYETAIATWFSRARDGSDQKWFTIGGILTKQLRYGENPHQSAAFYRTTDQRPGVATARQLQGKQLSYNNINDADAAFECVAEFDATQAAACTIVKHATPCGVAQNDHQLDAYRKAFACDPLSAFGGVVAFNHSLEANTARAIVEAFTEAIIAPDASEEAIAILAAKKGLRLLLTGRMPDRRSAAEATVRSVTGGLLVQARNNLLIEDIPMRVVTRRQPSERELEDLRFAFQVIKHVKSNSVVYVRDRATVGIGAGQMSRVDSARMGAQKAAQAAIAAGTSEPFSRGAVIASDAYFPFPDGLLVALEAGATAVIQQGGSIRDSDVIKVADDHDATMIFTGVRAFRH